MSALRSVPTLGLLGLLAACGEQAATPAAREAQASLDVKVVTVDELEAEIRAARGKGLLVNQWATW